MRLRPYRSVIVLAATVASVVAVGSSSAQTVSTQVVHAVTQVKQSSALAPECRSGYYKNVSGRCVRRPTRSSTVPAGATAKCRDGTYSFSQHASGMCSHHRGVSVWIHHP
jgi:hypothetical protein